MLRLREMTLDEIGAISISRLRQSRTAPARLVARARMIGLAGHGLSVPAIAKAVGMEARTVRLWLRRFDAAGLDGLHDAPRSGRPATYPSAEVSEVLAAALTTPRRLGLPFASWTLDRLEAYLNEEKDIPIKRSRVLLFSLAHPRWEFVFPPKYAAYLNLIEPWWKSCAR
jgi:transposase